MENIPTYFYVYRRRIKINKSLYIFHMLVERIILAQFQGCYLSHSGFLLLDNEPLAKMPNFFPAI